MIGRNYKKNIFSEKVQKEPAFHLQFCFHGFLKGNSLHYASTVMRSFYATENNDAHIIKAIISRTKSMSNSVSGSYWNACSASFFAVKKYALRGKIHSKWADLNYSLLFKKSDDLWEMLQD